MASWQNSPFAGARIDFSPLAEIGENLAKGIERRRFAKDVSAIPRGPNGEINFDELTRVLLQHDRPAEAASFTRLGQSQNSMPSSYREFELSRSNPAYGQFLAGDKPTEAMRNADYFANLPPNDPRQRFAPRPGNALTAVDKKEIFSSEDEATNLDTTIDQLTAAKGLNDQTYEGYGAGLRANIGSKLPDMLVPDRIANPATSKNTLEWQKLMEPEAIKTMASSLKGATTDFELNKFVTLLSDPSTPRDVRKRVITRMKTLAERKRSLARERINELRGQTYFAPGGGLSDDPNMDGTAQPSTAPGSSRLQPGALVSGFRYRGGNPKDKNSWEPAR